MTSAALLTSAMAVGCLTIGFLRDVMASLRSSSSGVPHPGLSWTRAGTLGLWAGFALRRGFGPAATIPVLGLDLVPVLAFTALLHLGHLQGWKGAKVRTAGLWCWAISMVAFGLSFTLPG